MTVATKMNTTTRGRVRVRRVRRVRRVVVRSHLTTRMMVTGGNTGSNTPGGKAGPAGAQGAGTGKGKGIPVIPGPGGPGSTPGSAASASTRTRRDNTPREQTGALAHHQGMAPSCPLVLNGKDLVADDGRNGNALPIEVRRLAGEFIDSEECSAVPQGKKHNTTQRPFFFLLCLPTHSLTRSLSFRVCLANKQNRVVAMVEVPGALKEKRKRGETHGKQKKKPCTFIFQKEKNKRKKLVNYKTNSINSYIRCM